MRQKRCTGPVSLLNRGTDGWSDIFTSTFALELAHIFVCQAARLDALEVIILRVMMVKH